MRILAVACSAAALCAARAQVSLPPTSATGDGGTQAPKELYTPAPAYPNGTATAGMAGMVVVDYVIDKTGTPINPVIVSSNNPAFEESAVQAILKWRYKPATSDGQPVESNMEQTLEFERSGDMSLAPYSVELSPGATTDQDIPQVANVLPMVYPYELRRDGVTGEARAKMLLNRIGHVARIRIVSCTRPEFGMALAAALQGFEFTPAMKDGQPVETVLSFDQKFDGETLADPDAPRLFLMEKEKGAIHWLSELDKQPRPLSIRHPRYPGALVGTAATGAAEVEFLIQEDGTVRLPRIVKATRPEFGYSAVEAVSSWLFEPPLYHHAAVVARARVPFKFKPKPSEAAVH
jgi:TonB family protein